LFLKSDRIGALNRWLASTIGRSGGRSSFVMPLHDIGHHSAGFHTGVTFRCLSGAAKPGMRWVPIHQIVCNDETNRHSTVASGFSVLEDCAKLDQSPIFSTQHTITAKNAGGFSIHIAYIAS
jgi:hypothetical protein